LSPYLHFGHISPHEIYRAARAKPEFIDELVTWRELGFNMCARRSDYDAYESLPEWAQRTLAKHAADRRPWVYTAKELEQSETHDPLWNAAQRQLVTEGRIEPYLRMLWGKKILEWSPTPQRALAVMIDLNNKYALDGRDPNSYNGIMWVLGRYDRPWGPERPIFGTVRYMSSENTARKMPVKEYIEKYAG
jgi:deoxyribodipyrimidine photo-lyase